MNATLGILTAAVAILTVIQGWQMISALRKRRNDGDNPGHNPNGLLLEKMDSILTKLNEMNGTLGLMSQRINDCWNKLKDE